MSDYWGHDPKEIADWLAARKKPIRSNSGVVNFLYTYLDDPSEVMSKARVNETIDEIHRLNKVLTDCREFLRWFTPREDHIGDEARDLVIAIDKLVEPKND